MAGQASALGIFTVACYDALWFRFNFPNEIEYLLARGMPGKALIRYDLHLDMDCFGSIVIKLHGYFPKALLNTPS